ncbi:UNVERIFIED_CONTAM: hypothetical protein GTU68_042206 [Idotea baltica]|nr:hypothetical protein [Idotea baltica]
MARMEATALTSNRKTALSDLNPAHLVRLVTFYSKDL